MKVSHRTLAQLERGYSISVLPASAGQAPSFLAGSEGDDRLLFFDAPEFQPKVIAREPGGHISVCPLVERGQRQVVATTMFKPGFDGADATIRLYPLDAGECPPSSLIATLPYTHRIALLSHRGRRMLLASTLCSGKAFKEDWTQPGGVYVGEMPKDPSQLWPLRQIGPRLNKNHGMDYAELGRELRPGYLLSGLEGLFFMPVPDRVEGDWPCVQISAEENSDACAFDWDGDGEPEIFGISPFHGHCLSLHKKTDAGWQRTLIHDDLSLGHVVWAGQLLGGPALLAGSRRERRELRLYRPSPDGGVDRNYQVIDEGIGPSQLNVVTRGSRNALLYVAAHGLNEVRLYELKA